MKNHLKRTIAIQGGKGSFHEIAAIFQYGSHNIKTLCFSNFHELVESVAKRKSDLGIIAIENTVAGSLISNYALLESINIVVIGEILLRIEQNLMALPGQRIEDIKEVYSHPIALMQCSEYFKGHPYIRLIESEDTAMSAGNIRENNTYGAGAIGSQRAADLYGLDILQTGIETNKRNFTRFLVIQSSEADNTYTDQLPDKASISFTLPHKTGSLSNVLSIFSFYNINLTKIQSIPIIGKEWEYHFIVDLVFEDYKSYKQALQAVQPLTAGLQVFGEYNKAREHFYSNQLSGRMEIESIEMI